MNRYLLGIVGLLFSVVVGAADYRYVRFDIDARRGSANSVQAADFRLTVDGVAISLAGATATSNGESPVAEQMRNILDQDMWTKGLQFVTGTGTEVSAIWTIDLLSIKNFNGAQYRTANGEPERDPVGKLSGSTDGNTWVQIGSIAIAAVPVARQAWGSFTFGTVVPPVVPPAIASLPVPIGQNFTVTAVTDARLCTADLMRCSSFNRYVVPDPGASWICSAAAFANPPADGAICTAEVLPLPVNVPTVFPPLPVSLGDRFATSVVTDVKLCNVDLTTCSPIKRYAISQIGSSYFCSAVALPGAPADAATCIGTPYVSVPVAAQPCWSLNPLDYKFDELSAADSSYYTNAVSWQSDCNGKYEVQLYSDTELALARNNAPQLTSRAAINAYINTQQTRAHTASEIAAKARIRAKYATVVVPPTATGFRVQPQSATVAGTRRVYQKTGNGTRNTVAIVGIDIAGNTPCSATDRIGTTSYRSVKGQLDTMARSITGDYYAACVANP